jgi:hypothetical protein
VHRDRGLSTLRGRDFLLYFATHGGKRSQFPYDVRRQGDPDRTLSPFGSQRRASQPCVPGRARPLDAVGRAGLAQMGAVVP